MVRHEIDRGVATITLDDPAHRNALSFDMTQAIAAAVEATLADDSVGAIVVAATAPVFSSGGSLDDLLTPRATLEEIYRGFESIAEAPVPTIAAVAGPAIGAGVNVALACDVIVCSPAARFDPRFLDIGIHPGGGVLWRLRERIGRQATAALVLCGESLDGEGAARSGLAWRCVPDDELMDVAVGLAERAAGRPRALVRRTKRTLDEAAAVTDGTGAIAIEIEHQRASMQDPVLLDRVEQIRRKVQGR
jgi:enoyl-CoA hydratase